MSNSSSSKLAGQCLVIGGILSFLVFIIQILVSGPPPGNEHIFTYFANETPYLHNKMYYLQNKKSYFANKTSYFKRGPR